MEISPSNREVIDGVKDLYARHLDNSRRNQVKAKLRQAYWDTLSADKEKAQGISSLHQALADLWSENRPLFSLGMSTQVIGSKYQFTKEPLLVEAARRMLEMGADTIKTALGKESEVVAPDAHTLMQIALTEPFRTVFDMPFKNYVLWSYAKQSGTWMDKNVSATRQQKDAEYRELRDLAEHLLKTYNGSGKAFLLGAWECDYHLRGLDKYGPEPSAIRIQNMIDWCNIRQQAIDDAKAAVPHANIVVYGYVEVGACAPGHEGGRDAGQPDPPLHAGGSRFVFIL